MCTVAALVSGVATHGAPAAGAAGPCQLGNKNGQVKNVIYLQFDNTHFRRDRANVPSDLEQMPHLLNFLKGNGTLLTNDHTILISHTAGGILASLTGLYPDRNGQTVSNSYDYFKADGTPAFTSSFKYWNNTVAGANDPLPNMVGDGGQTTPAPWLTYTAAGCSVGGVSAANIELENNGAVSVRGGPTALAADAPAGATNIKVGSVTGFSVGQAISVDGEAATVLSIVTPTSTVAAALNLTAPLASPHAKNTVVYGTVATDPTGDVTSLFGENSAAWQEARASQLAVSGTPTPTLAQTDLVGIAIHCAKGTSPCANNPNARPDPATIYPGSDNGFTGLFGAKYVNPAIGGSNGCVKATDGSDITDQFGQCGFPGFDGALAKNTLGEVEAMQLHGVPVTFAYISDAHDNHVTGTAMGPGEAAYQQQLKDYDQAFATWFTDLAAHGIDKSNTLFVVTVDEGDHFAGGTAGSREPRCAHVHEGAVPCDGHDADVSGEPAGRDHDQPEGALYKQVNAPFGRFALDTLIASTDALEQPATQTGDLTYDTIETTIANLTAERDTLAAAIRAAPNDEAAGNGKIDEDQARAWIKQARSLLGRAGDLAAANPA